ncbi:hypothetical protein Tsubulata_004914 [Turnera subulata]|uniref:Ankyrin repeat domain-containing protein, chloroplastic n=1 Tax=Turnera subulata TaxID=218843 RepID=A0A9Q0JI85_9ROSI|nr:hypothetical protein Tsubulata_004914 [Turnera subulata]
MSLPALLNTQTPKILPSLSLPTPLKLSPYLTLKFPRRPRSLSSSSLQSSSYTAQNDDAEHEEVVIGDCVVFEEGVFEDPYLETSFDDVVDRDSEKGKKKKTVTEVETENLVPEKWREVQAEINITKKERRRIAYELQFNCRVERKRGGLAPLRDVNLDEYKTYREAKMAQLKPLVQEDNNNNPSTSPVKEESGGERVAPKNPRWAVYGRGLDDVSEVFNSGDYEPGQKRTEGRRRLLTKEEKVLLRKRAPDIAGISCGKWLPLQTFAAAGEFYLADALLKHNVNINAVDADGLTALHRAILSKKQAVISYLLRESADPFVRDAEGATLIHYAVQTASIPAIKLLLLYNVDINLPDNDGWTPLHLAVQGRRTDIVKLLLIKGADKTLKSQDGLTPLDLCLYSVRDTRTYVLIKLLKLFPKRVTPLRKLHSDIVSSTELL